MTTRAADHLHAIKQVALRRLPRYELPFRLFAEGEFTWDRVLDCARHLQLPDGSSAVRSMQYGVRLQGAATGVYTGYTRHVDIASSTVTERSLRTCIHEMAHALLHYDVTYGEWCEGEAWLECEADVTADIVLMMLGYAPRQSTQLRLSLFGNYGDLVAFFYHAGPACLEAAQQIYAKLGYQSACTQTATLAA